jgi:hypothetical protein
MDPGSLIGILILGFWVWALFDCIATPRSLQRNLPKPLWLVLVLLFPLIGGLAWVFLGRPDREHRQAGARREVTPRRPVGLEDTASYGTTTSYNMSDRRSAELDRVLDQWEAEQRLKNDTDADRRRDDDAT